MKTLKFSKQNNEFSTELRKAVKDYFIENKIQSFGNNEIYIKTLIMTLIYFVPFLLLFLLKITSVPVTLIFWTLMGVGMSGIGMVAMHDANHSSFSKRKWVNKLFANSLFLLGGFPPNWRFQHNTLHHGFTNIDGMDEDIAPVGVLRFSPHQPLKWIHKYQYIYAWFFYGIMTLSWVTAKDFNRFRNYRNMKASLDSTNNYNQLFTKLLISKILYYGVFLVIPILFLSISWYWVLAGFLIMHLTGGLILSTIFQTAHVVPSSKYPFPSTNGDLEYNWAEHQLYTTSDFATNSLIFSWLIGGLNFQIEHHLFPNISHIHYRKINSIVKQLAEKNNLPYYCNRSFISAIYQHIKMLKLLGQNKTSIATVPVFL
jgi:linoleoyl-CoA desaturase